VKRTWPRHAQAPKCSVDPMMSVSSETRTERTFQGRIGNGKSASVPESSSKLARVTFANVRVGRFLVKVNEAPLHKGYPRLIYGVIRTDM
jgi:hypothetical protein